MRPFVADSGANSPFSLFRRPFTDGSGVLSRGSTASVGGRTRRARGSGCYRVYSSANDNERAEIYVTVLLVCLSGSCLHRPCLSLLLAFRRRVMPYPENSEPKLVKRSSE